MPELPEVETTKRGLETFLPGARIDDIKIHAEKLRFPVPKDLRKKAAGAKIKKLRRRAKYILVDLDNQQSILLHLGMSGRLFKQTEPFARSRHDHVVIEVTTKDGQNDAVIFRDPRRFGMIDIAPTKEIENHRLLKSIGPEPFDKKLTDKILSEILRKKKTSMKAALLDQRVIAGLGNIYVCEAMYNAKIHPERLASDLATSQAKALLPAIRAVLQHSIDLGGSSLRDYTHVDGQLGKFKHEFKVYDQENKKCARRSCRGTIRRITQNGRSTFFCPVCQL